MQQARQRRHDPVDVAAIAGPAEPEEPDGEGHAARDDGGQAPLRDGDAIVGGELALVPGLLEEDGEAGDDLAHDHAEEGEAGHARRSCGGRPGRRRGRPSGRGRAGRR